jgi:eukaryotic-like serine/threonine-protein kinase
MTLCINPTCPRPDHPDNDIQRFCQSCGSQLDLQGRYRVMRLLSDKTGFGKVYEAYEGKTPEILKVLKEDLNSSVKAVELFQQEANVLGQLHHPGIPNVDGYFEYQTRNSMKLHCIVMEKIEGVNLEEWLQQQGNRPISQDLALDWLKQITEILTLVHSRQYLHRDIKPSNIMLRPNGQLVLIDFGTAREMTHTYLAKLSGGQRITAIESSGYTAPEQARGQAMPESDYFSLGRTFVFLLTARHPLDMYDSRNDILNWRDCTTGVSPLLLDLIDDLMARSLKARLANPQEILRRIEEIQRQTNQTIPVGNPVRKTTTTIVAPTQHRLRDKLRAIFLALLALWIARINSTKTWISSNTTIIPTQQNQRDKFPFLAFLAIFLVALGLVGLTALALSGINRIPIATQRPERKGKVDYFPYTKGADSQGRTAEFSVAVLSVEYKWYFGSTYQIQHNNQIITLEALRNNLEQEGIRRIMENPTEVVSVGTASCEGNLPDEEKRAFQRSQQIQLVAKKIFSNVRSVQGYRLLNLGQFRRSGCQANQDLTSYQRSVIIIGVKNKTPGVNVDEALRDRLEKKPFSDFKLEDYSLGSPDKFKTISSNL